MKRTARKKLQHAKWRMKCWIRANHHLPGRQFIKALNRKLAGHYNYFGLRSNETSLWSFYVHCIKCAFKWLNRRGGKRRSFNWCQFKVALTKLNVAMPRIVEKQRQHVVFNKGTSIAKASTIEEPDAGKLHVWVCAGGRPVTGVPTARGDRYTQRLPSFTNSIIHKKIST